MSEQTEQNENISANDNACEEISNKTEKDGSNDDTSELKEDILEAEPSVDCKEACEGATAKADVSIDSAEAAGCSNSTNNTNSGDPQESIYHVKWVYFRNNKVPIITQNENGPCPLLAIMNVLLLQKRVNLALQTEIISANQLMTHLGDCVLQNVPGEEVSTSFKAM